MLKLTARLHTPAPTVNVFDLERLLSAYSTFRYCFPDTVEAWKASDIAQTILLDLKAFSEEMGRDVTPEECGFSVT